MSAVLPSPKVLRSTDHWLAPWLLLGVLVAALLGGINVAIDHARVTPSELYDALSSTAFAGDLPSGVELKMLPSRGLDRSEQRVTFAEILKTDRAEGGAVLVHYDVEASPAVAHHDVAGLIADVERHADDRHAGTAPFELESVPVPNACLRVAVEASCSFALGPVRVEVVSRLPGFDPDAGSQIGALTEAAYEHLATIEGR